jgi:DNA-binding NarL/FixJ family response regulator
MARTRSERSLPQPILTPRQVEMLTYLRQDVRAKQIAERLCLAEATVRMHIRDAYARLEVHSAGAAVWAAFRLGLLGPDGDA